MEPIDASKIPDDVMVIAFEAASRLSHTDTYESTTAEAMENDKDNAVIIALLILSERADCAQHAFAMRWAPSPGLAGTKNAALISQITTDWSQKIGMGILNR